MARKSGSGLSIYENLSYIAEKSKTAAVAVQDMEGALIHWCSAEGGFYFNRKAASHLAAYMKMQLYSQQIMVDLPMLTKGWIEKKEQMGLSKKAGIATGMMMESIKAIDQGYGRWKVGISQREAAPFHRNRQLGTYKTVLKYAEAFEYGGVNQQARPWFYRAFMKWTSTQLPGIAKPLLSRFNDASHRLRKAMNEPGATPKYTVNDIITGDQ